MRLAVFTNSQEMTESIYLTALEIVLTWHLIKLVFFIEYSIVPSTVWHS